MVRGKPSGAHAQTMDAIAKAEAHCLLMRCLDEEWTVKVIGSGAGTPGFHWYRRKEEVDTLACLLYCPILPYTALYCLCYTANTAYCRSCRSCRSCRFYPSLLYRSMLLYTTLYTTLYYPIRPYTTLYLPLYSPSLPYRPPYYT